MKRVLLALILTILVLLLAGCGCKHSETELVNAVSPTCTEEGYTGDTVCLKCNETVAKGETVERLPHTEKTVDALEPSCTEEGYTGNTVCSVCGELLAEGEAIPATGHTEGELMYKREATCTDTGYSGDVYCTICGALLREGEPVEKLAHVFGEPQNFVEATCSDYGYTGDVCCTVCGEMITQGERVDRLEHTFGALCNVVEATCLKEGYSGDKKCSVCGEVYSGSITPTLTHEYEDNTCVLCGWRVSGLYVDGKLELTWQQLKDGGYVEVENHALINCSDNLMGTLVVDEEISSIPGYQDWRDWYIDKGTFEGMSSIEYIWLPRTVTAYAIENAPSFAGCSKLREVITFGEMTEMGSGDVFANCSSLERIDIPYGTSVIGAFCFFNCANLKEISIPETVQSIEDAAFVQSGITEITLPEGVQRVDLDAFGDTAVKRITLPSSVTTLSGGDSTDFKYYDFHDGIDRRYVPNQNLEYIDASACNIDELYSIEFYNFNSIKTILLPNSLKKIDNYSLLGYKPIVLILPEGFKEVLLRPSSGDPIENIHSIVWPTSFTTVPKYGMSFNTIYFRGSEMQWKLIENIDKISYKNIVFNYEGDGSELMD